MEQYIIKGGHPLVGEVEIGGAKNAALAILAAAIMTDETVRIENLPDVNDINVLLDAIAGIGAMVQRTDRHTVKINAKAIHDFNIEYDYIKKIRASFTQSGQAFAGVPVSTPFNSLQITLPLSSLNLRTISLDIL